jgi:hypothetical protein
MCSEAVKERGTARRGEARRGWARRGKEQGANQVAFSKP